jgi:hypothetical protein
MVVVQSNSDVVQVIAALRASSRLARVLDCRHQQGHKDAYDGNDYQQFDE